MAKPTKGALLLKFHLYDDADRRLLRSTFSKMAQTLHPDKGGNAEAFKVLRKNYDDLYAMLPECCRCKDTGYSLDGDIRRRCECQKRRDKQ